MRLVGTERRDLFTSTGVFASILGWCSFVWYKQSDLCYVELSHPSARQAPPNSVCPSVSLSFLGCSFPVAGTPKLFPLHSGELLACPGILVEWETAELQITLHELASKLENSFDLTWPFGKWASLILLEASVDCKLFLSSFEEISFHWTTFYCFQNGFLSSVWIGCT